MPELAHGSEPLTAPLARAHAAIRERLRALPEHEEVPVPAELALGHAVHVGRALTMLATAFRARGVRYGRLVAIEGEATWILNLVTFSDDGWAIPLLGLEVLVFRDRAHLVVADLFPLDDELATPMPELRQRHAALGESELPGWARAIFSTTPILAKPRSEAAIPIAARAIEDVTRAWALEVERARPARVPHAAAARRDGYAKAHAEDEPAVPFLARMFGDAHAQRLVHELLFPPEGRAPFLPR